MHIGGFQRNSLIDFPETIACVIFTQGCNFICPYCHNPDLVKSPFKRSGDLYDENEIFSFLEKRRGFLEGVVITGGEPTLQDDLTLFCKKIRKMGYKIKLDSNGSRPEVISRLLNSHLVDFISMDIKTSLENYDLVIPGRFDTEKIVKSIALLMEKAPAYEFRTTCCRPFVNPEIVQDIGSVIKGASKYILQKCSGKAQVLEPQFLKSEDDFFSDDQMLEFKDIIDEYVVSSVVR